MSHTIYLQDVQGTQLSPTAFLRAVHLCPFDDDCVSRKVNAPSQGSCGDQNLRKEEFLSCERIATSVPQKRNNT